MSVIGSGIKIRKKYEKNRGWVFVIRCLLLVHDEDTPNEEGTGPAVKAKVCPYQTPTRSGMTSGAG
jgi:hypothetical protein